MAISLVTAQGYFTRALSDKQQYEAYLASHPGAVENGSANPLFGWHVDALGLANDLRFGGFPDAASMVESDNAAALAQWYQAHPTLGIDISGTGDGGGVLTGGGGTGSGTGTGGSGGGVLGGIGTGLGDAYSLVKGVVDDLNGLAQVLLNPGKWFAGLGQGLGSGIAAAGTQGAVGVASLWTALAWPAAIIAGLVAIDRIAKGRRRSR